MDGEIMQRTLQGADAPAQESFEELIAGRSSQGRCSRSSTGGLQSIELRKKTGVSGSRPWRSSARIVDWIGRMRRV